MDFNVFPWFIPFCSVMAAEKFLKGVQSEPFLLTE
jgi:hypothetical protein